ncbi:hypothetical protein BC938DRAFT_480603 [Jimgerdemannia flammicorona]|uniref:Uncharacterized protein n=1 Tax=Jimgerdemannia flammicorona TaxID=994334 RepID=A0A433QX76_9FUNG|nr:hypothetical protein BC938DRAFT_480603 [Jimgerdemannia flammicorona]
MTYVTVYLGCVFFLPPFFLPQLLPFTPQPAVTSTILLINRISAAGILFSCKLTESNRIESMTYPSSTKFKPTYRKKCRNELLELCAGRHLQVDQSDSKDKLAQSLVDYDIAKDPYVHRTKLELAALLRARNLVVAIRDPKTDMVRRLLEDDQRIASNIRGDGDSATSTSVYGSSAYKSADDSGSDTSDSSISSLYESDGAGSRTSEAGSRSAAHDTLTTTPTSAIHDTLTTTPTSAAHDTLTTTPTSAIHDTLTTTPTSAAHDILTATLPSAASSLVLAAPEPLSMSTHSPQILFTSDGNTAEERSMCLVL